MKQNLFQIYYEVVQTIENEVAKKIYLHQNFDYKQ